MTKKHVTNAIITPKIFVAKSFAYRIIQIYKWPFNCIDNAEMESFFKTLTGDAMRGYRI